MKYRLLCAQESGRNYAAVFDPTDDVLAELQRFCESERVYTARLYGIGGLQRATLAFYNLREKKYEPIEVDRDGHTTGGHLLAGTAQPTLELMVDEIATSLHRTDRPEIGIPLIDL